MSSNDSPLRANSFFVTSTGPVSISAGSEPILAKARIFPAAPAKFCARFAVADQHGGGAIDDAGGIAGMVDMIDALDFGWAWMATASKPPCSPIMRKPA